MLHNVFYCCWFFFSFTNIIFWLYVYFIFNWAGEASSRISPSALDLVGQKGLYNSAALTLVPPTRANPDADQLPGWTHQKWDTLQGLAARFLSLFRIAFRYHPSKIKGQKVKLIFMERNCNLVFNSFSKKKNKIKTLLYLRYSHQMHFKHILWHRLKRNIYITLFLSSFPGIYSNQTYPV